jgi:hypothetical protein
VIGILSICESICHVHEFCYCFWFYHDHLLDEIYSTEPYCKSIDWSLVRDVFCWIFWWYSSAVYMNGLTLPILECKLWLLWLMLAFCRLT